MLPRYGVNNWPIKKSLKKFATDKKLAAEMGDVSWKDPVPSFTDVM